MQAHMYPLHTNRSNDQLGACRFGPFLLKKDDEAKQQKQGGQEMHSPTKKLP